MNRFFGRAQMVSAGAMGFMHGTNDAQKTMGIIALTLLGATKAGHLENLPGWLSFLHTPHPLPGKDMEIAVWIKVVCALTMAAGTAVGGWRIIKTLGHKMVKLQPINGFAAETSSATVILAATHLGIPVSTTHNISAAIMGVGAARRLNAIKWTVVERMVWAWVLTIPISGLLAYGLVRLVRGWSSALPATLTIRMKKASVSKPVERLFPFVMRSRILIPGRDSLGRSKSRLHFVLITHDLSEASRAAILADFAHYPVVQHYTAADLEKFFEIKGTKVVGFQKSGLAQSIYAELKEHRVNQPPAPARPRGAEHP